MSESSVSPTGVGLATEGSLPCTSVLETGGEGMGSGTLCSSWLASKKEFRVGVLVSGSTGTLEPFLCEDEAFLLSSACDVGVFVWVEEVVPLRVLGFDLGLDCCRRLRDGFERVEPTSESSSSPLS